MTVNYSWPGAGPAILERQVTAPLEGALALVRDVEDITSVSRDGSGRIQLTPRKGADADFLRFNIAAQVRRLYPSLPDGVGYPTISYSSGERDDPTNLPVMTYSLAGPAAPAELYRYATEQLAPQLSLLSGLSRLEVTGGNRPHWRIALRPEAAALAGLNEATIRRRLQEYFGREGLGFITDPGRRDYTYISGGNSAAIDDLTVGEWEQIPMPGSGDRMLTLGDLAEISRVPLPARSFFRINGANSIRLLAYATEDANRLALATELRTRVRALKSQLTPGYNLLLEDDATRFLRDELSKTRRRTALSMGILLIFVLIAYRSVRRLGVVVFSLAVNLGLAFLCYWLLGVELNLYAFAGIAVSFGIMVDNVIIVLDGLRRPGGSLGPAIIGATLTTLAGLSVIWFLSDELRTQLFELARVMAINLTTSVVVALGFVPALEGKRLGADAGAEEVERAEFVPSPTPPQGRGASGIAKRSNDSETHEPGEHPSTNERSDLPHSNVPPHPRRGAGGEVTSEASKNTPPNERSEHPHSNTSPTRQPKRPTNQKTKLPFYQTTLKTLLRFRKTVLFLTLLAFGLPLWWLPNQVDDWPIYNETIGSDFYRDNLRPHLNKYLGGSFRLFSYYVYEGGGYRPAEETRLYVNAALPDGATVNQLNDVVTAVEAYLQRYSSQLDRFTTRVYSGQNAGIEITFPNGGKGGFPFQLKSRITAYATNFGGIKWNIYGVGQGYSNNSSGSPVSFRVTLKGYNQAGLDEHSERLAELLLGHPRVQEVNTDGNLNWWEKDRYEYRLDYRPQDLARRGLTPSDLRAGLDWFDRNNRPDFYLRGGEPVAIVAENGDAYNRWRLENWSIPTDSSQLDFPAVGSLEKRLAPQSLHKENQQYLRLVNFEYLGSPRFGSKHLEACLDTLRAGLPLGFTAERRSYRRDSEAKRLSLLMGLAVVLIFFICALLFESLRQALNIVLLIPVSCIGIFLTFYWFNVRLDQGGYTSFLLVTGLAVNGLILIVNEFNWLRRQYTDWTEVELYATAVRHKILPIVLTVVSTAAGLVPFLLGGRNEVFWHALAAGTIGGLVFSVVVITVISPVFFLRRGA
ncbi:MAG: multidrug efflux pump subunit AcrB [Neolewinella sp.]|jgi:multidrug efflux pump subunit AcrB